jgi:hypothetical protein
VVFEWKAIKEIIADIFIKALPKQKFQNFINIIRMVDIKKRLAEEKQLEDLRDNIKSRQKDPNEVMVYLTH